MNTPVNTPAAAALSAAVAASTTTAFVAYSKTKELAPATLALFLEYVKDAPNWNGSPLVNGNVGSGLADVGRLSHMKMLGLVVTERSYNSADGSGKTHSWIGFTQAGADLAKANGVELSKDSIMTAESLKKHLEVRKSEAKAKADALRTEEQAKKDAVKAAAKATKDAAKAKAKTAADAKREFDKRAKEAAKTTTKPATVSPEVATAETAEKPKLPSLKAMMTPPKPAGAKKETVKAVTMAAESAVTEALKTEA